MAFASLFFFLSAHFQMSQGAASAMDSWPGKGRRHSEGSQMSRVRHARESGCHYSNCHSRNAERYRWAGAGKCGLFLEGLRSLSFPWAVTLTVECPGETDHSCAFWRRPGGVYAHADQDRGAKLGGHLRSLGLSRLCCLRDICHCCGLSVGVREALCFPPPSH